VIVSVKEGQSTDILNSSIFQTNPAVNFGFAGVSVTVCDVCHVCGGAGESKFLPLYTSTLLLDRVSQKNYMYRMRATEKVVVCDQKKHKQRKNEKHFGVLPEK
jgi:hypothetical protein